MSKKIYFFFKDKKAQGEWNTLYLILVLAIVTIVLIKKVKPLFKTSVKVANANATGVETKKVK